MQDRFKFRHWDKRINKMFYPERNDNFGYYVHNSDIIETMQCTGLKDKNGTLIYEGDIVKFIRTFENKEYKGIITYDKKRSLIELTYIGKKQTIYINKYQLEVIGNIYENRELLNA